MCEKIQFIVVRKSFGIINLAKLFFFEIITIIVFVLFFCAHLALIILIA